MPVNEVPPKNVPYARVIADSVSDAGDRLTTMEVRFHRFVLAEFNTHRVFSRNSASSRARSFPKVLGEVFREPVYPLAWPVEQKGMQGGEDLAPDVQQEASASWDGARMSAATSALTLHALDVHKSVANRLLEPFMMHTVVVTATSWSNFFEQRVSPLAQPEIRIAAEAMLAAHEESAPKSLKQGQWHLPYIQDEDWASMSELLGGSVDSLTLECALTKVSAARCARVSYLTQDGKRDLDADLRLYERLVSASPWHGSPLEHVATPWHSNQHQTSLPFTDVEGVARIAQRRAPLFGNLLGWRQLRLEVEATQGFTPLS